MGKSTVAAYLAGRGESLIDTDILARELVGPGQPALREIEAAFGKGVIGADGGLDRTALAQVVFNGSEERKVLEAILHPRIRRAWKEWAEMRAAAGARRAVVIIPLLFETGADAEMDFTICVACSPGKQRERLRHRGLSDDEIQRRIAAQMSVRDKMEKASRVVWNDSSLQICELQVARVFASLPGEPGRP